MKKVDFLSDGFMLSCNRLVAMPIIITAAECSKCIYNQGFIETYPGELKDGVATGMPVIKAVDELTDEPYIQPTPEGQPKATPRPYVYETLCGKPTKIKLALTGTLNFEAKE